MPPRAKYKGDQVAQLAGKVMGPTHGDPDQRNYLTVVHSVYDEATDTTTATFRVAGMRDLEREQPGFAAWLQSQGTAVTTQEDQW